LRTQSPDTHPEAERVQISIMRQFTPARKFELACNHNNFGHNLSLREPHDLLRLLALRFGKDWVKRLMAWQKRHTEVSLHLADTQAVILDLCAIFTKRQIPFALAGTIACGIYGLPSSAPAIEFIVDYPRHIHFSSRFIRHGHAYLDAEQLVRIDVVSRPAFVAHAHPVKLIAELPGIPLITPEDLTVMYLERFAASGRRDDALYNDLLGMLKVQALTLDTRYLQRSMQMADLLALAFDDVGVAA
jgi:hypothetical protein